MQNVYSFTAAAGEFHYYRKIWKPKENEKLDRAHEENNPFDWFAIKTVTSDGMIVGHLPREITKFFSRSWSSDASRTNIKTLSTFFFT